jgi:hypothetical protein
VISIRKGFKPQTLLIRAKAENIINNKEKALQRWSEYYEKHFELQDGIDNDRGKEWTMCVQKVEPYIEPPGDIDIDTSVSKLKNGKAPRHDQIPAELIEEGEIELKKIIYELILKIWEEEIIPHEWKYGIICPIHKKGDTMICDDYRAVTLLCSTYKILANILYSKLLPYAEEIIGEYQGGFQREINC